MIPTGKADLHTLEPSLVESRNICSATGGLGASGAVWALIAIVAEIKLTVLGHMAIPSVGADDLGSYVEIVPFAV